MDSIEKMYSVKEVAHILGWSPDTIRRLIDRGLMKALELPQMKSRKRIYRPRRVAHSEVERFRRNHTKG